MATQSYLRLGSKDHCFICSVKITDFNHDRSGTNWSNCLKLLTRYCDIDPLQLFDISDGIRKLLMNFMSMNQQLEQLSFNLMCRQCVEKVAKLESSLNEMKSAKNDFETTVWSFRNRILTGTRKSGLQKNNLDPMAVAGNNWRKQFVAKCVPSVAKLLTVFAPISESGIPTSNVVPVSRKNLASNCGKNSVEAGKNLNSTFNRNAKLGDPMTTHNNVSTTTHNQPTAAVGTLALDDVSMTQHALESDENDAQSTTPTYGSVDTDVANGNDTHEKSQSTRVSIPSTLPSTVQNPFTNNTHCSLANVSVGPRSTTTLHSESNGSYAVSGKRKRQPPERFSYDKDFFDSKSTRSAKKSRSTSSYSGLKCPICSSNFRRPDEVYFHELLMHPFDKLRDTLPPGTSDKDIRLLRDYYIKDCKAKSRIANSGAYECVHCDISYLDIGTGLSELKIHLFKDHFDKIEELLLLLSSLDLQIGGR